MFPGPRFAVALIALSACGAGEPGGRGRAAAAQTGARTVFDLQAQQAYQLPPLIPDDLLQVNDVLGGLGATVSLRTGEVIGAWTTTPTAAGEPAALVYRCHPDADGDYVWSVAPDAGLVPLGMGPAQLAAVPPFVAEHTEVEPAGIYLYGPSGPAWTITEPSAEGPAVSSLRVQLIAPVDVVETLSPFGDAPPCRYKKAVGATSGGVSAPTLDRADYVLRLDTVGGVGPDLVGAPCDPGSLDVRSEVSADFYFVALPGSLGPPVL